MSSSLQTLVPLLQTRWRQGRRIFDSRLLNERRLIIVAVVALSWFVLDATLVTPSFKQFNVAAARYKAAKLARDTLLDEVEKHKRDRAIKEIEAQQ